MGICKVVSLVERVFVYLRVCWESVHVLGDTGVDKLGVDSLGCGRVWVCDCVVGMCCRCGKVCM